MPPPPPPPIPPPPPSTIGSAERPPPPALPSASPALGVYLPPTGGQQPPPPNYPPAPTGRVAFGPVHPSKPWWQRKRLLIPIGVLVLLALVGSIADPPEDGTTSADAVPSQDRTPETTGSVTTLLTTESSATSVSASTTATTEGSSSTTEAAMIDFNCYGQVVTLPSGWITPDDNPDATCLEYTATLVRGALIIDDDDNPWLDVGNQSLGDLALQTCEGTAELLKDGKIEESEVLFLTALLKLEFEMRGLNVNGEEILFGAVVALQGFCPDTAEQLNAAVDLAVNG